MRVVWLAVWQPHHVQRPHRIGLNLHLGTIPSICNIDRGIPERIMYKWRPEYLGATSLVVGEFPHPG